MEHKVFRMGMLSKAKSEIYGLSIILIMLFHAGGTKSTYFAGIPGLEKIGKWITVHGSIGVEVFLLMSGITLYFSYHKNQNTKEFIIRRLKRILPALFIIFGPYWFFLLGKGEINIMEVCLNFLNLNFWIFGRKQVWFISLILVLYVLYPFIYRFLFQNEKNSIFRLLILLEAAVLLNLLLNYFVHGWYDGVGIGLTRIPIFLFGCWLGKYVYEDYRFSSYMWIVLLLQFMISLFLLKTAVYNGLGRRALYFALGIPLAFLFAYLGSINIKVWRRILSVFGGLSLELYLAHIMIRALYRLDFLFFSYKKGQISRYLFVLLLAFILAFVVSKIEKFIFKGKQRRKYNDTGVTTR